MAVNDQTARRKPDRPGPRVLTVQKAFHLTPNMIRVTFGGNELQDVPEGREGGNCKLLLPEPDQTREDFVRCLQDGAALTKRTYTVRHFRKDVLEMDIDFVAHGDDGPASRWARRAGPGSFCGFAGPGVPKLTDFDADWYLIAADMSALPVAAATLEAMPRDAVGTAIFEITTDEDRQEIDAPDGIDIHWSLHPDPHVASTAQEDFIRALAWPTGKIQTCIAGESSVIRALRTYVCNEKGVPRSDAYISGYWKIGLIEDQHQIEKRSE